jgi:hypothetical protein
VRERSARPGIDKQESINGGSATHILKLVAYRVIKGPHVGRLEQVGVQLLKELFRVVVEPDPILFPYSISTQPCPSMNDYAVGLSHPILDMLGQSEVLDERFRRREGREEG